LALALRGRASRPRFRGRRAPAEQPRSAGRQQRRTRPRILLQLEHRPGAYAGCACWPRRLRGSASRRAPAGATSVGTRGQRHQARIHAESSGRETRNNGARRSPWCVSVSSSISSTFFRRQCRRTFCDAVLPGSVQARIVFKAEGPEPVIDDGCGRFPAIPVSPIGLAQPVPERRLFAAVAGATVEPHAADQAVGFLQRDCEAARPAGQVILLYASYPLAPIGFALAGR
jgi:hypothetical protein